ncbi:MAG: hypothetical protein H3C34_24685, partial [Caldilineaceae bacterium]|nr:hypothetical protein [Caldilineaceae bacterium]
MTRGSTWNKWDFHLHTPYSILNNQFGDPNDDSTWERYVQAIEEKAAALNIAAIGITDYFLIDGYKRLLEFQANGRLANILLFPNIEFRIDKFIYRSQAGGQPKRVNYHVLFSPDVPPAQIEEHFLHDLEFVSEDQPYDRSHVRKLKRANLEKFGETLQRQQAEFREKSALEIGCMNATVDIEKVKEQLHKDGRFRGRYLLVLAEENLSLIDWASQDSAARKHLVQMSHAVFSSNPKSRSFLLGKSHPTMEDFLEEFKSPKPCIWGCDCHGYKERFLEPDEQRFCWIKGEVSWEGLKQILYEPDARVRIQPHDPEPSKSTYTLDRIHITETQINDSLRVCEADIALNPNLVAIIGGRGSGKTALLDLIADCFPDGEKIREMETSFHYRLYHKTSAKPIQVKLQFQSGEQTGKAFGAEHEVFGRADILYLTQNHIDDYTANPTLLYSHIIELVFENRPDEQRAYVEFSEHIARRQREIDPLVDQQLRTG